MGKPGNPAKAAHQHTLDEARAAVRAGKSFLLRPLPHTEVLVKSTEPDEAVEVIEALQPATEGKFTAASLQAELDRLQLILTLANGHKAYNEMIAYYLDELVRSTQLNAELHRG